MFNKICILYTYNKSRISEIQTIVFTGVLPIMNLSKLRFQSKFTQLKYLVVSTLIILHLTHWR